MSNVTLPSLSDIEFLENPECVHYWIIDIPSGPVSKGKCCLCGESKEFRNYLESASGWDDDRTAALASSAGRSLTSQLGGLVVEVEEEY